MPCMVAQRRPTTPRGYSRPSVSMRCKAELILGYKEFSGLALPVQDESAMKQEPAFQAMLDRTKLSTHQYAKSQLKWIRKQLVPAVAEARHLGGDVQVYVVRGGTVNESVVNSVLQSKQARLTDSDPGFLAGNELPDPRTVGHPAAADLLDELYREEITVVADTAA